MLEALFGGIGQLARDLLSALERALAADRPPWRLLLGPVLGLIAAWFVYVPIHELMHVAGCLLAGGTVTELRLAPMYGASLLQNFFPFIVVSSEYAGRLTGFTTNGSDLVLLVTDAAPYLLTIAIGVPLLRRLAVSGGRPRPAARGWLLGPAVVLAAAPIISLTGDYYEMASVLLTRGYSAAGVTGLTGLRSDDLFRLIGELWRGEVGLPDSGLKGVTAAVAVIACSTILALCLASCTYKLGVLWGRLTIRKTRRAS